MYISHLRLTCHLCSRVQRKVVCNAEGVKAFVKNASQQAAVLAASTLIAGVRFCSSVYFPAGRDNLSP
jgi:hypothetical protein